MPAARAPTLRHLLRTTTTTATLRQTPQLSTRTIHNLPSYAQSQSQTQSRSRSPSPPPPYIAFPALTKSIQPSTLHWTRYSTPYTLSSIRTFTSSPARPATPSDTVPTSPDAAQKIEEAIEHITELYGTAKDEFEIAIEETEKNTTYAADDRAAAREELDKLLEYYGGVVEGGDGAVAEEVKRRVGQRIRELEQAVLAMEESVVHGD